MDDHTMLELAAKAAGYKVRWHENWQCFVHELPFNITQPPTMAGQRMVWVPLDDDGDAFRLQVQLHFLVQVRPRVTFVNDVRGEQLSFRQHKDDARAATRYAVTRAAAEVGRKME